MFASKDPSYKKKYYEKNKHLISEKRKSMYLKNKEKGLPTSKNTCAKRIPNWLVNIPPGEYTLPQLAEMTGQKYSNVYLRFTKLEIERVSKNKNSVVFTYLWRGAEYYVKKFLKEAKKK